jgi:DNA-binding transcriptional MerR regulator
MLISEFARKTGLTTDTVRLYVRRGLLTPETNGKGGRNPYQVFTAEQVRRAKFVCTAQSLGLSLKDLAAIGKERQARRLTPEFSIGRVASTMRLSGTFTAQGFQEAGLRLRTDNSGNCVSSS